MHIIGIIAILFIVIGLALWILGNIPALLLPTATPGLYLFVAGIIIMIAYIILVGTKQISA